MIVDHISNVFLVVIPSLHSKSHGVRYCDTCPSTIISSSNSQTTVVGADADVACIAKDDADVDIA